MEVVAAGVKVGGDVTPAPPGRCRVLHRSLQQAAKAAQLLQTAPAEAATMD